MLLPFIEQSALYDQLLPYMVTRASSNFPSELMNSVIPPLMCPSDPAAPKTGLIHGGDTTPGGSPPDYNDGFSGNYLLCHGSQLVTQNNTPGDDGRSVRERDEWDVLLQVENPDGLDDRRHRQHGDGGRNHHAPRAHHQPSGLAGTLLPGRALEQHFQHVPAAQYDPIRLLPDLLSPRDQRGPMHCEYGSPVFVCPQFSRQEASRRFWQTPVCGLYRTPSTRLVWQALGTREGAESTSQY